MRKVFLLLVLLTCCLPLSSQTINFKQDTEKDFQIATNVNLVYKVVPFSSPDYSIGLGLSYYRDKTDVKPVNDREQFWIVMAIIKNNNTNSRFVIEKNSPLCFKTISNKIVKLTALNSEPQGDKCFSIYSIPKDQLQTLINEGVSKIRFVSTAGVETYEFKDNIAGKTLTLEYNLVVSEGNKQFNDNF